MDKHYCNVWTPTGPKEDYEKEWLEERKKHLTASDISTALGHNSYKTPLELWEEKTGRKQPADLSNKPAVKYGKENEARIREEFAEENKDWCSVAYAQYDIYVSAYTPFLGATLDGEITVESDDNPYAAQGVKKGDQGILEIKTGGYYSLDDVEERWGDCPIGYVEQVRGQMYCTGDTFAVLKAELQYRGKPEEQGGLPEHIKREFFFKFNAEQEKLIVESCKDFWEHVEKDTAPAMDIGEEATASDALTVKMQTPEELMQVDIEAQAIIGSFMDNFSEVKVAVEQMVEPYKGLVFTEKDCKTAKEIRASLNKKISKIKQKRIQVSKDYCKPLDDFVARAKELEKIIQDAVDPIGAQITCFEDAEREKKRLKVLDLIDEKISDFVPAHAELFREHRLHIEDAWFNKTTSMKKIGEELDAQITKYHDDMEVIFQHAIDDDALYSTMQEAYLSSGNLLEAFKAEERYKKMREAAEERERVKAEERARAEEKRREEEERRAQLRREEEARRKTLVESVPEQPESVADAGQNVSDAVQNVSDDAQNVSDDAQSETPAKAQEIIFTFKAAHTSVAEWKGLITYMKQHGFKYTQVQ